MALPQAVIEIGIDPYLELGPLRLAWHGLMIAVGVAVGAWLAARYAREGGLDRERLYGAVLGLVLAGIAGAKLFWVLENDAAALVRPGDWFGARGFSIYGAILFGVPALALYLRRGRLSLRYLDAMAAGFPVGLAVGRIGDVINGEHYGPPSELPWAFRHTHPDADVPSALVAYHSGGFYEVVLGLTMLVVVWSLRRRFRRPAALFWTVIALYGAGRFVMFFWRSDSDTLALSLSTAQWTSLALVLVAAAALTAGAIRSRSGRSFQREAGVIRPESSPAPGGS
jgi:phosphatidylglycerol:prolipoprotein diacylglycerol transferase